MRVRPNVVRLRTTSPSTRHVAAGEVDDLRAVGAVEVPGVPLHRVVRVQLEQVRGAAWRQHLAAVRLVETDRITPPSSSSTRRYSFSSSCPHWFEVSAAAPVSKPPPRQDTLPGHGPALNAPPQSPSPASASRARSMSASSRRPRLRTSPGLAVHPRDRRAGQDVVELVQQHDPPESSSFFGRVVQQPADSRRRRPQLRLAQQVLRAAVALLHRGLRGVGAAVDLQVELARPHRRVGVLRLGSLEERRRRLDRDDRRAREGRGPSRAGEHLPSRPAAAVAVPERHQRPGRGALSRKLRAACASSRPVSSAV